MVGTLAYNTGSRVIQLIICWQRRQVFFCLQPTEAKSCEGVAKVKIYIHQSLQILSVLSDVFASTVHTRLT